MGCILFFNRIIADGPARNPIGILLVSSRFIARFPIGCSEDDCRIPLAVLQDYLWSTCRISIEFREGSYSIHIGFRQDMIQLLTDPIGCLYDSLRMRIGCPADAYMMCSSSFCRIAKGFILVFLWDSCKTSIGLL